MSETRTRKSLIWIIGAVGAATIAGLLIIKVWFASTVFMASDETVSATPTPPETVTSIETDEPLDAQDALDPVEQRVRDMVTPVAPGTPVMPDAEVDLDPSDYSRDLARFIPIEIGMDRYVAKDELLLYYNAEPLEGSERAKVSSTERMIDGATLFVIRRSGLADDSLAAEETYALFDEGTLVDFGSRIQCRRGPNANRWTTELCP